MNGELTIAYGRLILMALSVFIVGMLASIPLSSRGYKQFYKTRLFIKIIWWIPIFGLVLVYLHSNGYVRGAFMALLVAAAVRELLPHRQSKYFALLVGLFAWYTLGLVNLLLYRAHFGAHNGDNYLLGVWYGSVLSDVGAFFMGSYAGRHHLPKILNKAKSWEGVVGQLAGALLGVALLRTFVGPLVPWWLVVPIGVGSAAGDLLNSYVKRQLGIKEWSQAIPGHGGYLDRCASLAGAATLSFYLLIVAKL